MMKSMKKKISAILAGTLMLGSFSAAALAETPAADAAIRVQLDGQMLSLQNDAAPVLNDNGRVYLPFRSLFETLGADVTWDQNTGIISAVRDGREVEFTDGQAAMVIKETGGSRIINTSAAPYIENGRTMIPVRFAGEALGYNIGWDSVNKTVVMMDSEKLANKYADKFNYLQKLLDLNNAYNGKAMDYAAKSNMLMLDESTDAEKTFYEFQLEFSGTTAANGSTVMSMTMTDGNKFSAGKNLIAQGYTQEKAFNGEKITMDILLDMDNLVIYMKSPLLNEQANMALDADAYYSIDMKNFMTAEDLALIKGSLQEGGNKIETVRDYLVYILDTVDMDSVEDYNSFVEYLDEAYKYFGDDAFKYDQATGWYSAEAGGASIALKMDANGKASEYNIAHKENNMSLLINGQMTKIYLYFAMNDYGFNITMDMNMDYKLSNVKELKTNPLANNPGAAVIPLM